MKKIIILKRTKKKPNIKRTFKKIFQISSVPDKRAGQIFMKELSIGRAARLPERGRTFIVCAPARRGGGVPEMSLF